KRLLTPHWKYQSLCSRWLEPKFPLHATHARSLLLRHESFQAPARIFLHVLSYFLSSYTIRHLPLDPVSQHRLKAPDLADNLRRPGERDSMILIPVLNRAVPFHIEEQSGGIETKRSVQNIRVRGMRSERHRNMKALSELGHCAKIRVCIVVGKLSMYQRNLR